ncbi:MAG: NAD(P)-dependent alcohol dehydrogenase [Alteromonadaceae bacterium]|nr:NAD(P)-dependent alcohol dehydrogenase [Alteromonadaceae bacterium]
MKAVVYNKFGLPDVLELKEVAQPAPKANEVLIKIHAVSINDWDWGLLRGKSFINRMFYGLLKPKTDKILGSDIAGTVEAVGRNVKDFKPGDDVFGDLCANGWGGFAEYVCAPEKVLVLKPSDMSFEQAAAIPQAAVLALQAVRDLRPSQSGLKVLINGAGGGSGSFAVQIAKVFGDEVTGVDSANKFELLRSLGADHVIDYTQENFPDNGKQYDLIIDMMGYHSIFDYKRSLSPKGRYVMVGGGSSLMFQSLFLAPLLSLIGSKKLGILPHDPNKGLDYLKELFQAGKLTPVIDRCYPLSEVAEAMQYFGERKSKGKVIITVD